VKSFFKSFLFVIIDILVLFHWGFLEIANFLKNTINGWIDVTQYIKATRNFISKYFNYFLDYLKSPNTPTIIAFLAFFSVVGIYEYIHIYVIGDMLLKNMEFGNFAIILTLNFTLLKALFYVLFSKIMLFLILADLWKATKNKLMAIKILFIGKAITFITCNLYPLWIESPILKAKKFYSDIRNGNFNETSKTKLIIAMLLVFILLGIIFSRVSVVF